MAVKFVRHELWQQEQIRALIDNSSLSEQEVLEGLSRGEQYSFNINGNVFEGDFSEGGMGDYQISFKGYINGNEFDYVSIGRGYNGPLGNYLYINDNEIQIRQNHSNEVLSSYKHGITEFKEYISVNIIASLNGTAQIQIMTNDGYYSVNTKWLSNYGKIFVDGNAVWSDCVISHQCNGWYKPIWIFGDSYMSMTDGLHI